MPRGGGKIAGTVLERRRTTAAATPTRKVRRLNQDGRQEKKQAGPEAERRTGESGIIVFGGGNGCSGRGCLFWILISVVLSVTLTVLLNLVAYLFSGPSVGM
jgi:hypothetical protein